MPFRRRSRKRRQRRSSASVGAPRIVRARERWFDETPGSVFTGHPSAAQPSSFAPSARPLLPRGERGPKGRMRVLGSRLRKRPALRRQLLQQGSRLKVVAELGLKLLEFGQNGLQSDCVGIEHRTAAIDRPAVAVDPDDVDVGRALGLALLEDFRALVDHRVDAALEDFGVADLALFNSLRFGELVDDPFDVSGRFGRPRFVVIVETRAGLLAAPALFAQDFAYRRALRGCGRPADVEAGEIGHREWAHRQTEVDKYPIDVPRLGAFENELRRLALTLSQHAVADEAVADADHDPNLADLRRELRDARKHRFRGLRAAYDLE